MLLLASGISLAQEASPFTFDIGGGFTQPIGRTGRRLDEGWNIRGSAGYNFNRYIGAVVDLGYNRFDVNGSTLTAVGFPGGNVNVFSATFDPVIHVAPGHHVDMYVIYGGGLYRVQQQFTQPSATSVVGFDPFFGFYNALIPATQVLSEYTVNKPGINAGAGFAMGTKWHGKFFAEARYHRVVMGNSRYMDFVPVSFGFRW